MDKLPPIEKIYEAYTAITDNRVVLTKARNSATVTSSSGAREYFVSWDNQAYTSTDSATYWQGYPGYPIIAVLMLQKKLTFDKEIAALFSGINWTELNKKHNRDYASAVAAVIQERHCDVNRVNAAVNKVYEEIKALDILVKRGKLRPSKSK